MSRDALTALFVLTSPAIIAGIWYSVIRWGWM